MRQMKYLKRLYEFHGVETKFWRAVPTMNFGLNFGTRF